MELRIASADFADPALAVFVQRHLAEVAETSPPESCHVSNLADLTEHQLWTASLDGRLVGMVGLLRHSTTLGELKSMRVDPAARGHGVGWQLATHALAMARRQGMHTVSLETGTSDYFLAARKLYRRIGFRDCGPFGGYRDDPFSVYLTIDLRE